MPKQQHTPEEILMFSEGALYAVEYEYAGLVSKKGYLDARNMRLTPMNNNDFSLMEIGGEVLKYPAINNACIAGDGSALSPTYKCMFAAVVNGYIFEIWCDSNKVLDPLFRINGKIVAKSAAIPFTVDYGIQGHQNDACIGGEVFLTDDHSSPQIYNIKDLLENSGVSFVTGEDSGDLTCTQKYFLDYNVSFYSVNQATPADHPVFIEIMTTPNSAVAVTLGAGGLIAGSYQYLIQYRNLAGDSTSRSEATPLIPVPKMIGTDDKNFPYEKTYGDTEGNATVNGIHFRFRVTNVNNYNSLEILRVSFNTGSPLGSLGVVELIHSFSLTEQEIAVYDFADFGVTGTALSSTEQDIVLSVIDHCKAIRYFDKQLYLMNITYASRDVDDIGFIDSPDDALFPVMYAMGKAGHSDPYHSTYYKCIQHREIFGWGIEVRDSFNARSFVLPVPGASAIPTLFGGSYNNYEMPSRRDPILAVSDINGVVTACNTNNVPGGTYEVFDLSAATAKDDPCQYKNIMELDNNSSDWKKEVDVDQFGCTAGVNGGTVFSLFGTNRVRVNWQPFHPTMDTDPDVTGHNFPTTTTAWKTSSIGSTYPDYKPQGFSPNYYTMGMALNGLTNLPTWAASFSLVRTPPAGRIFCEGLGFYSLNEGEFKLVGAETLANKLIDEVWFYSADVESGVVNINDVINNPTVYEVQMSSPVGFFSEVFNFRSQNPLLGIFNSKRDYQIDMMSYARIMYENNLINQGDPKIAIGQGNQSGTGNGYVSFGKWRNTSAASVWTGGGNVGNQTFDIVSVTAVTTKSTRQTLYKVKLNKAIYAHQYTSGNRDFDDLDMRNFHEPLYVMNICRKGASQDTSQNQTTYMKTGHYQKIVGIIGKSNGSLDQSFILVDERWEDCIPTAGNSSQNKFVYVTDTSGTERPWVNIFEKSPSQLAIIISDIQNGTNVSGANASGLLSGVYTHTVTQVNGQDRFYYIRFNFTSPTASEQPYYVPTVDYVIKVRYDNQYPCISFGGDVVVGENVFAPIDGYCDNGGDPDDPRSSFHPGSFSLGIGMPYFEYDLNPRLYVANRTDNTTNKIQNDTKVSLTFIRQQVCMFPGLSRISVPYAFNQNYTVNDGAFYQFFPLVNYVMRANKWQTDEILTDQNVFAEYITTYPEELDADGFPVGWQWGGLRFKQSQTNENIDYSHAQDNFLAFNKPKVGFIETNHFCSRVVWSVKREINVQNSPGLKTFPATYFRDLNDNSGDITHAYDAWSNTGNNLYAFCEGGVCQLLTNKFVMRQMTGDAIGIMQAGEGDSNIMEEIWLSGQGLPGEFWRSFAEYNNVCWYANPNSVFRMEDNNILDIGRRNYHSRIYRDMLQYVKLDYTDDLVGWFDVYHSEYWLSYKQRGTPVTGTSVVDGFPFETDGIYTINAPVTGAILPPFADGVTNITIMNISSVTVYIYYNSGISTLLLCTIPAGTYVVVEQNTPGTYTVRESGDNSDILFPPVTFVWLDLDMKADQGRWIGHYDYNFDKFTSDGNITYGMREAETYTLDQGMIINGATINADVLQATTGDGANQRLSKEFWRIRINSNVKPTRVEFYETLNDERAGNIACFLDASTDSLYLKNYIGFENYVPRKDANPRDRMQGRGMIYKVKYSGNAKPIKIVDIQSFFKPLK